MDINKSISARFNARINQRTASARSGRWDLRFSDYEILGPREAKVMISYAQEMGSPKRSEMDEWVMSSFNGGVSLVLESLKDFKDHHVVTAFVRRLDRKRPLKDAEAMLSVGKDRFSDGDIVWDVIDGDNGERFLSRASKDDIQAILDKRLHTERTATVHHRLRIADLVTAGIHNLEPGDKVRFSYEGILQQGDVSTVGKDNVTVKANGKSVTIDRLAVLDVFEQSPKTQAQHNKFLVDFFTEAYGDPSFAQKFVKVGE